MALTSYRRLSRVPTGVPGLDTILNGGLFRGGLYMLMGPPGAGKTILSNQIAFHQVASGNRVIYVTLLAETHTRLLDHLRTLAFFDPAPLGDRLSYFSGYGALERGGLDELLELVRSMIEDNAPTLLVVDGLTHVKETADSARRYRYFLHALYASTEAHGCTTLLLGQADEQMSREAAYAVVDGVVELSLDDIGGRTLRELRIWKLRGSGFLAGRHVVTISDVGVAVYPRIETRPVSAAPSVDQRGERKSFASPRLDQMLHGGVTGGSTTVLLGPTGSGKTLLGLHFLAAGDQHKEMGAYFGFYEAPARLLMKADAIGLDLSGAVARGMLEVRWNAMVEDSLDRLAEELLTMVQRHQVRRLFIDGLDALQMITARPERINRFFAALSNELRARHVTTVYALELNERSSRTVNVPVGDPLVMTDNIICLRSVELSFQHVRAVAILKVRDSAYDPTIRTFTITNHGIVVGEPMLSIAARLTVVAHQPAERAVSVQSSAGEEGSKET